jgi:hypothetical protein
MMCGGVRHFLGRDLKPGDHIALRPLRDLVLRDNGDGTREWLSEYTLQVSPAPRPVTFRSALRGITG